VDYQEAVDKLWNHANLPEKGLTREASFIFNAWQTGQRRLPADFQPLYDDILSCLTTVNLALNGPVPSESTQSDHRAPDLTLCSCVSGILSAGWFDHFQWSQKRLFSDDLMRGFATMLVRIGIAWDLVLAGDIDNLPEETELNFTMGQA
jgi:hypothetical protein